MQIRGGVVHSLVACMGGEEMLGRGDWWRNCEQQTTWGLEGWN